MTEIWTLLESLEPLKKGCDSDEHVLPEFALPTNRKPGQVLGRLSASRTSPEA
jgi:hypothetical protein